jgi:hypothetical protein
MRSCMRFEGRCPDGFMLIGLGLSLARGHTLALTLDLVARVILRPLVCRIAKSKIRSLILSKAAIRVINLRSADRGRPTAM